MGYETERAAIEGYLKANWTATLIKWPNVAFEPGDAIVWIEPWIANATAYQASLGSPATFRHPGILSVNIRVRPQTGTALSKTHADTLGNLFRGKIISNIIFKTPKITQVGDVDGWYLTNWQIHFFRDEVFSFA